jgi:hypothetical protein
MMIGRALLATAIVGLSLHQAGAQFGGMPGMPGSGGFGTPQAPPPECQQLLTLRDDVEKHGKAIQAANQKRASVKQACGLFKNYLAAESKMIKAIERSGTKCGVPSDVPRQMRENHAKASVVGKQVCDAASQEARGGAGPSLSDALGANPPLPNADTKGAGVFDTLTGNPFAR